jgi:hypothetical protein
MGNLAQQELKIVCRSRVSTQEPVAHCQWMEAELFLVLLELS